MGDKAIAIGIGSSLPVTLYRLGGNARGRIVPDTWTQPAFGPASGCRGLRPCMILHCLTGETVVQRSQIVNAVAFTVSGLSDASCGPFTFVAGGNFYSITLDYTGFSAMNGTYVSTTYEHPYSCEVSVRDVSHTFSQTIKYNMQINGGAISSSTCNATTTVRISPYNLGSPVALGASFVIECENNEKENLALNGFEYLFYRATMQTLWPCSNPPPFGAEPVYPGVIYRDGRGGGAWPCGFKNVSAMSFESRAYHASSVCNPFLGFTLSRAWS